MVNKYFQNPWYKMSQLLKRIFLLVVFWEKRSVFEIWHLQKKFNFSPRKFVSLLTHWKKKCFKSNEIFFANRKRMCQKFWTFMWTKVKKNLLFLEIFFFTQGKINFWERKCDFLKYFFQFELIWFNCGYFFVNFVHMNVQNFRYIVSAAFVWKE